MKKICEMNAEELEVRAAELRSEVEGNAQITEARMSAIEAEYAEIESRRAELKKIAEERTALSKKIAGGAGIVKESGGAKVTNAEVRASEAYINAFANYIKTGDDAECRALLTETVSGTVPVPTFVEGIINHAWDDMPILSKVTRTNFAGNVKIGFEMSASDATIHAEGSAAPAEEELVLGIVTMVPETIKKWITVSDEAIEQNPVNLIQYVYSELSYRIFKKAEDEIVAKIKAAPTTATATAPSVKKVTITAPGLGDVVDGEALLSDEAGEIYVICTKATEAAYKKLAMAANYAFDPFQGHTVLNNDTVGADTLLIGDLKAIQANFTNGTNVSFKYDDISLAEKDMVKIVGRLPVAIALVADKRFAKVTK